MADLNERIVPLDELDDFEVAEGDPDVRGWDVFSADGRRIGEVDELLVDTTAMKVRYLDVDLDDELLGAPGDDRHILIPIGYARLQRDDDRIRVDGLDSADLAGMPRYTHGPLTREFEMSLMQRYNPTFTPDDAGAELYDTDGYNETRFYGARRDDPLA